MNSTCKFCVTRNIVTNRSLLSRLKTFKFFLLVAESSQVCVLWFCFFFFAGNSFYFNKSISVTSEVLPFDFHTCSQNVPCFCLDWVPQKATGAVMVVSCCLTCQWRKLGFIRYSIFLLSQTWCFFWVSLVGVMSAWCLWCLILFSFDLLIWILEGYTEDYCSAALSHWVQDSLCHSLW